MVKISRTDRAYDPKNTSQVIQAKRLVFYGDPPFRIDAKFRAAFRAAIKNFGGIDSVAEQDWLIPTAKLLRIIYEHYS